MYGVIWSIVQLCSRLPLRWLASDFVTLIVEVNLEFLEFVVPDLLGIECSIVWWGWIMKKPTWKKGSTGTQEARSILFIKCREVKMSINTINFIIGFKWHQNDLKTLWRRMYNTHTLTHCTTQTQTQTQTHTHTHTHLKKLDSPKDDMRPLGGVVLLFVSGLPPFTLFCE